MTRHGRDDPNFPRKERPTPSIWDADVDTDKLARLSKAQRAAMFPNDYDADGNARGDF